MKVWILRFCGNVDVLVPRGTHVVVRRMLLCGNRDIVLDDDETLLRPKSRLTLTILSLCGNVRVRNHSTSS